MVILIAIGFGAPARDLEAKQETTLPMEAPRNSTERKPVENGFETSFLPTKDDRG
jgi:hypothetical protein